MISRMRIFFLMMGTALIFSALVGRLYYLQVIKAPDLQKKSERSLTGIRFLPPVRGLILDRNERALAANKTLYTVLVDRTLSEAKDQSVEDSIRQLGAILGMSEDEIQKPIEAFRNNEKLIARVIARELNEEVKQRIVDAEIPGVDFDETARRIYPEGTLASHVLGFTGSDSRGLAGIELALDSRLKGRQVMMKTQKDIHLNLLSNSDYNKVVSNHGIDIELTIDSYIQYVVERELRKVREEVDAGYCNAVVMNPKTGEILALANYPTFDPNEWDLYPPALRQNRMLADHYEPGSVMKPFILTAALDRNKVTPDMKFFCENGFYRIYGKTIRDDVHRFGVLSVHDILVRSSNIGMVKIARRLGENENDVSNQAKVLYEYLRKFGFKNNSDPNTTILAGEAGGILRPPERWNGPSIGAIPFGQEMTTNTLILTAAYCALANRGVYRVPQLVKGYRTPDDVFIRKEPKSPYRIIDGRVIEEVDKMLIDVTEDPEGTGSNVRIPGFHVAGKTGTAQKYDPSVGTYGKGMRIASFAGFFPAEDPQVCIVVMVDEPKKKKYGGAVAGPVWKAIAEEVVAYWGLSPTWPNDPLLIEQQQKERKLEQRIAGSEKKHNFGVTKTLPIPSLTESAAESGVMPQLVGLPLRQAYVELMKAGVAFEIEGSGKVVSQTPKPGERLQGDRAVRIVCGSALTDPEIRKNADLLAKR